MGKGIIFDADGTLLDSMGVWYDAGVRFMRAQGMEADEELSRILFTMSMQEGASYLKTRYSMPLSEKEIVAGVNDTIRNAYFRDIPAKAGVPEALARLKAEKIPIALATATDRELMEAALTRLGLFSYFDAVFTCSEVGKSKHFPDIFFAASKQLGTPVSETWVFEDAFYAAQTAKQAGFMVAGVYDAMGDARLRTLADVYLEDFGAFAEFLRQQF